MPTAIRTLHDLHFVEGENPVVLLRLDLNVPVRKGKICDDYRIKAALPTIKYLHEKNVKLICCSHLGRPRGIGYEQEFSMLPIGERLAELLELEVVLVENYLEDCFSKILSDLKFYQIILLENLRFHPEERQGKESFANQLTKFIDYYVNDAFGTCHRTDASIVAAAQCLTNEKRAAGFLIQREVQFLEEGFKKPEAPVTAVFGGSKVSDKISILKQFTNIANNIIIGGAMAYTFLHFKKVPVGKSMIEADKLHMVAEILDLAQRRNVKIYLPIDHICAEDFNEKAKPINIAQIEIADNLFALDIGPQSSQLFASVILGSKVVMWNGPMGVFEWPAFANGTKELAYAVSRCPGLSIVGGGDSAAAIAQLGLQASITHISTGGGASMKLLEGSELPGLKVLRK